MDEGVTMQIHNAGLTFRTLSRLSRVEWLVVHTAAGSIGATARDIHAYHLSLGWGGAGYHYFIHTDGTIEKMRPDTAQGAHARGLNATSLGVCCAGHGDRQDFTPAQKRSLAWLLPRLRREYDVPRDRVIGHREVHTLAGAPPPGKSCPGSQINMQEIRELSDGPLSPPDVPARVWSNVIDGGTWLYPTEVRSDGEWHYLTEAQLRRGIPGQQRAVTPLSRMPRAA
jgi:N-acetylmuramoyl-L-alanine amidase